ncbi:dihydrolipoamide acetyltransferase family protein [Glaciibacter superstes]|uniref:dihydrolipoamide acetyltransferase family protein n=1 Tax=Glaciibacter superstes TaxID=501023 RepID=UPI0003B79255|nr:dihydrolipoamide acetyltransferase family protein [Glaciibacter superstes]
MSDFILPDLGEGLTEAEIVSWLVSPGDTITIDQPVVEVESAKSVVELPSPYGGVVEKLFGDVGQTVHAGTVLLRVNDTAGGESGPGDTATVADVAYEKTTTDDAPPPAAEPAVAESSAGSTSGAVLVGYGTRDATPRARRAMSGRFGKRAPAAPAASVVTVLDPARRSPVVSPLVRRLARENGFDATQLAGSGRDSLVLRRDVESFIRKQEHVETVANATPETPPPGAPAPTSAQPVTDTRIPITGLRKAVSQRLTLSRKEIPEATIWMDVDATELFSARDQLLAATGGRFSVTALIARFVIAGLREYPVLNSSVDTASQEILQHGAVNLGLAAQTSRGLMVPVVHNAHAMTTRQLRNAIAEIVTQSADGTFPPSALAGGTFTLNNFGALGVDGSAAIINHPEAAILGIGRMIERPWVVDHQLAVRTVVELSMVFDHRVCDGGTAAGFLTHIARSIESPVSLLAEL